VNDVLEPAAPAAEPTPPPELLLPVLPNERRRVTASAIAVNGEVVREGPLAEAVCAGGPLEACGLFGSIFTVLE